METKSPWIAVVDDDAAICRALVRLLRSAGLSARAFPSGAAFLQTLNEHHACCVILDVHMPEQTGLDVQARLATLAPEMGVILISGHPKPQEQFRALHQLPLAYLQKPVNDQLLLDAIAQVYPQSSLS
ncbi:response regulator transcription factor [Pseudoduganella danionis]|uniref:Response regulator n=1 Tax=Pseudoduganella danionis TaxID=1890295 RepID=A0ABW9SWT4_9BURK|nr:response regulator [Pseudoduganella danionis]MTW35124.1 response regulator [Pseudoduganella danionis]